MSGSAAGDSGGIDLENIHTGVTAKAREKAAALPAELRKLLSSNGGWGALGRACVRRAYTWLPTWLLHP